MMKRFTVVLVMLSASLMLWSQSPSGDYEQLFKEGIAAFDKQEFETARTKFKRVVNLPETSPALRKEANAFIESCNDKIRERASKSSSASASSKKGGYSIAIHPSNLSLPSDGGTKEITIEASADWEVKQKPDWCKIMEITDNYLKIWCDENPESGPREGEIALTLKNSSKVGNVHLFQERGTEKSGMVYFRTIPGNTLIEVHDSGIYGVSSRAHSIKAGTHDVRVLKDGYEPLDTTIVVPVSSNGKTTIINLELKPEFGILTPEIHLEDNGKEPPFVDFRINRKPIDISNPSGGFSFDDDGVIYNNLYKGGRIPLRPGLYEINISAEGYESYNGYITVGKGEDFKLEIDLSYKSGFLTVVDDRNAEGGIVNIDETIFTGVVGERMRLPVGDYIVEVDKEGYMLDTGILDVRIDEGADVLMKASMTRMVDCVISTDVQGETVYVNGEKVPYQKPSHIIPLMEGKSYVLEVHKEGYWPYRDSIYVSAEDTLKDLSAIQMKKAMPLKIRYDEPNIRISLYARGDSSARDYAGVSPSKSLDTTLYVPYGRYDIKMVRRFESFKDRRLAYKGRINFTESKDEFRIQTWSYNNFIGLGGDYNIVSRDNSQSSSLPAFAYAYLGQFKICNGLSTNLLKASIYDTEDCSFPFTSEDIAQPKWTIGASWLFLNYDFRIGGEIFQYADANILASYAWYPSYCFAVPLTHFSGQDVFIGLEATSRIKYFNVNFRFGVQYLKGRFNCYDLPSSGYINLKDSFVYSPVDRFGVIASLGFAIGGKDSKGRNILRIW